MPHFLISWQIDEEADSPQEAIRQAITRMPHPGSSSCATIFEVVQDGTQKFVIDADPNQRGNYDNMASMNGTPLPADTGTPA